MGSVKNRVRRSEKHEVSGVTELRQEPAGMLMETQLPESLWSATDGERVLESNLALEPHPLRVLLDAWLHWSDCWRRVRRQRIRVANCALIRELTVHF